jgi:hypothetical protein
MRMKPDMGTQEQVTVNAICYIRHVTGCEFSGMQKFLAVAMAYVKRGRRKRWGEKNTWHAEAAWRMEGT